MRETSNSSWIADTLLFSVNGLQATTKHGIKIAYLPHRGLGSISELARKTVTQLLTKGEKKVELRKYDILCIDNTVMASLAMTTS